MTDFYATSKQLSLVEPEILVNSMSQISLPNLQQLYLEDLVLTNVEALAWIHCPNLKKLYLMKNNLQTLKPLIKMRLTSLERIEVDSSISTTELDRLVRVKMTENGIMVNKNESSQKKKNNSQEINTVVGTWAKL